MLRIPCLLLLAALLTLGTLGTIGQTSAQDPGASTPIAAHLASLEAKYASTATISSPTPADRPVGYDSEYSPLPSPSPAIAATAPTIIPPINGGFIYPTPAGAGGEVIIPPSSDAWCMPPQEPGRTSSWTAAIELIPSRPRLTDAEYGRWDNDDGVLALRFILGYEDPKGLGVRGRFWWLAQDAEPAVVDVELDMDTFQLDFYKRLFLEGGDVAIGAGPAGSGLKFDVDGFGVSRFTGAGGTVFLDGYYGLLCFDRSELGAIGRARHSILLGDWRDTTGGAAVPATNNDTLSITELAWGMEYRSHFGACEDHSWFLGVLAEYQRWQSDWLSNTSITSVGVSGLNVYTGLNW